MFKVVLGAALVTLAVAASQPSDFCRDVNGDSLLDGFYRLGDSCRHFVQCKDGENALPNDAFMSCEPGLQFVSGALAANEDGERTQQGACMDGGEALDCDEEEVRQKRETLDEPTNGTLAVNNVDMTVFNVERPRRQSEESLPANATIVELGREKRQTEEIVEQEAETLLEEEKQDQNATVTVNNKDVTLFNIKRDRRQVSSEDDAKNGTLAVKITKRESFAPEEQLTAKNESLAVNNVDMTVFNIEKRVRREVAEETDATNGTLAVSRPRRQTVIMGDLPSDSDSVDVPVEDEFRELRGFVSQHLPGENRTETRRPHLLRVVNNDVTTFNTMVPRERRQTASDKLGGPHVASAAHITGPDGAPLASTVAPSAAESMEIVAPASELSGSTRGRRQASDVCKRVLVDGLYMVRSPICDSFVECKNKRNTVDDESVMQCDEGLMFARASKIIKNGKPYMVGKCVEYIAEECNKLLHA